MTALRVVAKTLFFGFLLVCLLIGAAVAGVVVGVVLK